MQCLHPTVWPYLEIVSPSAKGWTILSVELLAFGPQLRQAVSRASCLGSEQVYVTKKFEKKILDLESIVEKQMSRKGSSSGSGGKPGGVCAGLSRIRKLSAMDAPDRCQREKPAVITRSRSSDIGSTGSEIEAEVEIFWYFGLFVYPTLMEISFFLNSVCPPFYVSNLTFLR